MRLNIGKKFIVRNILSRRDYIWNSSRFSKGVVPTGHCECSIITCYQYFYQHLTPGGVYSNRFYFDHFKHYQRFQPLGHNTWSRFVSQGWNLGLFNLFQKKILLHLPNFRRHKRFFINYYLYFATATANWKLRLYELRLKTTVQIRLYFVLLR